MARNTVTFMKSIWLSSVMLFVCTLPAEAIYGPGLTRATPAVSLRACREADFTHSNQIIKAMQRGDPAAILRVVGGALKEWRATPATSTLYPARSLCIHDLIPNKLPPSSDQASPTPQSEILPTPTVDDFLELGIKYFYYEPDRAWVLRENPVDLNQLAAKYLYSRWGREAFLLMTQLGWSQGSCMEGPDQFRQVIKHGTKFLADYPKSEISDDIRLETANAYATWWNLSVETNTNYYSPARYKPGARNAKQAAITLYQEYLSSQKKSVPAVQIQLKALKNNPNGSNSFDYFCADYED